MRKIAVRIPVPDLLFSQWFRVGLPGKSGVGGGILCIAPGQGSIAVWSPGLNEAGTSLAGAVALEHFAYAAGWSVFD